MKPISCCFVLMFALGILLPGVCFCQNSNDAIPTINNIFYDSDLRQVLVDLGAEAGVIIIASPEVSGYVTCELDNVPWPEALDIVLAGSGFVAIEKDNFILVALPDPDSKNFWQISKTNIMELNYLTATGAQQLLPPSLRVFTQASPDGRTLSATAPLAVIDQIKTALSAIDIPSRQIMLEARIVTMQSVGGKRIGMEYDWPGMTAGGLTAGATFMKDFTWVAAAGLTPAGELSNALKVDMDFMISNDEASSVANPRVLASEGKEALISVMTEEYFKILTEDYYQRSTLEKVETGISLKITPRIGANDEITMDIQTEVSDVIARGGDDDLPVITRRKTTSKALVPNMGTVIISGLEDHHERVNTKKVPILGYIPLIGKLFTFDQGLQQDSQVVVFITPRIVDAHAPNLVDGELIRRPLPPIGRKFKKEIKAFLAQSRSESDNNENDDNQRSRFYDNDVLF